jgi:hypothetical protein
MAIDFRTISATDAEALLDQCESKALSRAARDTRQHGKRYQPSSKLTLAQQIRAFIDGDHWQDGDGWGGPIPINPETGQLDTDTWSLIRKRFVSTNVLGEIVERATNSSVGREQAWGLLPDRPLKDDEEPSEAEQKVIDDREAKLTVWWDKRDAHSTIKRAVPESLGSSRALLRLWIPRGLLEELPAPSGPQLVRDNAQADGAAADTPRGVIAPDLDSALDRIYIDFVDGDSGAIVTDPDTMDKCGIVIYERAGEKPQDKPVKVVELSFLDGSPLDAVRKTVVRTIDEEGNDTSNSFDLGGRLTHYAIELKPLITEQLVAQQIALNFTLSMLPRNVETAQYLERIVAGGQMPGTYETGADGKEHFIPGKWNTGAGVTNWIEPKEVRDPTTGNTTFSNPTVTFREPSSTAPTIESVEAERRNMLQEAHQGHVIGTNAAQSGISKEQGRADFTKRLNDIKGAVDPAGRWLIETVLVWSEAFVRASNGAPDTTETPALPTGDELRATFSCFIDAGPLDTAEQANVRAAIADGTLSLETGLERLNVEDVDAEIARLNAQPGRRVELRTKLGIAFKQFLDGSLSPRLAAKLAGFSKEEQDEIEQDAIDNPTPSPSSQLVPAMNADGTPQLDANGKPVMVPSPAPVATPQKGVTPPQLAASAASAAANAKAGAGGAAA